MDNWPEESHKSSGEMDGSLVRKRHKLDSSTVKLNHQGLLVVSIHDEV